MRGTVAQVNTCASTAPLVQAEGEDAALGVGGDDLGVDDQGRQGVAHIIVGEDRIPDGGHSVAVAAHRPRAGRDQHLRQAGTLR